MVLSYPDTLTSIGATFLTEKKTYTREACFLMSAINGFTCMGGPNYHPGTTRILDEMAAEYGHRETFRFLYLIEKISSSDLTTHFGYVYFWDWFKRCRENLSEFKRQVEERASDIDSTLLDENLVPESIRKAFD